MIALDDKFLRGSITPLVTPLRDGKVDYDAYAGLVRYQVDNGSHGVLVNGTTAEPSTLTLVERKELLRVAVQAAGGRVPVVAATGSQSHKETVELTEAAERDGANALLVVTPYYVRPPQRGLAAFYRDVASRTRLPLMIYHIPGRTAIDVEMDTLRQIADEVPTLVGIKHAVADLGLVTDMLKVLGPQFRVFVGLEEYSFPMMAVGACGLMNAVANVAPRLVADLANATAAGDLARARALHFSLYELNKAVFFDTNPIPMKYMMRRLGILARNEHRLPMMPATPELEARLDGVLRRAGLLEDRD
ncbi:2,4-dihydroxyhept-2-ene-1,7-dioic acid aldolase [Variovorax defluvii]|uniref:4-hydroxy-tetrahydrodipicolinate synthase n=1 Tax=Variovorax defluvii TaxID=913761 RepID=A0ABP8ICX7_9BURK